MLSLPLAASLLSAIGPGTRLILVGDPGQLVSVSSLAQDPRTSLMADRAAAFPANHGRAEEIYLLRPDLVLASSFTTPATLSMLRRLGVPVAQCVMRYKRSLMPFERFSLRTQIIGWNERRFFMAQDFVRDGQVVASGQLQYAFVGPEGRVAPATIFSALLGREAVSPPLPAELLD